jgi:hypothetical protein
MSTDTGVGVPGRSHKTEVERALARQTHMKGGITDNGKESQGREEEGQETLSSPHPVKKKGGDCRPLFIF